MSCLIFFSFGDRSIQLIVKHYISNQLKTLKFGGKNHGEKRNEL